MTTPTTSTATIISQPKCRSAIALGINSRSEKPMPAALYATHL